MLSRRLLLLTLAFAALQFISVLADDDDPDSIDGLNPSAPPVIPPPGRCFFPEDCKDDEFCQASNDIRRAGTCKPKLAEGVDCQNAGIGACQDDLFCELTPPPDVTTEDRLCREKSKLGEKCNQNIGNEACVDGLVCPPSNICSNPGKEGDACRSEGCANGLYCKQGSNFEGTCAPQVAIGGTCSEFRCCVKEAIRDDISNICVARRGEDALCAGGPGDDICAEGLKCNGDEVLVPNTKSPPRCVKVTDLIRKGGAPCKLDADNCDDSRFLVCRERHGRPVCVFELPAGPCNPGSKFEVCLPDNLPSGVRQNECREVLVNGKGTGEFACQAVGGVNPSPTTEPTTSPLPKPTPEPECRKNRDCKSRKICKAGRCVTKITKCSRAMRRRCRKRCKWCDWRTGKCVGKCPRGWRCVGRRCRPSHRRYH